MILMESINHWRARKEGEKAKRGAIKGAVRLKLKADKDNAYLSRKLAEILIKIPINPKINS